MSSSLFENDPYIKNLISEYKLKKICRYCLARGYNTGYLLARMVLLRIQKENIKQESKFSLHSHEEQSVKVRMRYLRV